MLPPVRVVLTPGATLALLGAVGVGVVLGTCSGLVPGLHANNFALVLAAVASDAPGPPALVGAAMLSAGVVHTFLDAVPALALGVPDAAMAASALPGHRLVLGGRGREALRLSALGSGAALLGALVLAVPVTEAMRVAYPVLRAHLALVLGSVAVFLVAGERSARARLGGGVTWGVSTLLGLATLDLAYPAPLAVGGPLLPLFAGLFGAPVLLDAVGGAGVPEQGDAAVATPRRGVGLAALAGTLSGAAVGYLPGVSSAVAAVVALAVLPTPSDRAAGDRRYLVATSGVNTAVAVFALFALVTFGDARTGVLVAFDRAGAPIALVPLLGATALAGAAGFVLVLALGDRYLAAVGRLDPTRLSVGVLCLLVGLAFAFAGVLGVVVFAGATLVGRLPVAFGARRVHCMGVLAGPLLLSGIGVV